MTFPMYDYRKASRKKSTAGKWAEPEDIAKPSSGRLLDDIILGRDASIAYYERDKDFEHGVNNNVCCFGGTGAGKSYDFIMPNLANHLGCTYVVTDPKGELDRRMGPGFEKDGYEVQVLDTINPAASIGYDPLRHITREEDIATVVNSLFNAISPDRRGGRENDTFWDESSELLMRSLVAIAWEFEHIDGCFSPNGDPGGERKYLRMNRVLDLFALIQVTEANDGEDKCPLDYLVEGVEKGGVETHLFDPRPEAYGVVQYRSFRTAASRTLKSIIITVQAHISKLNSPDLRRIFEHDEMRLDTIDQSKRFIDIKMSDSDSSRAFLANIFLKQLVLTAERKADASPNGRLARPVMFVLDEFPNIGKIPDFERTIATVRSRGMSFLLCCQSISQLGGVYGSDAAHTICDNCDTVVYMGSGSSIETAKYMADLCGEWKAGTQYVGVERTEVKISKPVITPTEVRQLPRTDCLVMISNCRPFRTKKFGLHDHPNYRRFVEIEKPRHDHADR